MQIRVYVLVGLQCVCVCARACDHVYTRVCSGRCAMCVFVSDRVVHLKAAARMVSYVPRKR